MKIEPDSLEYKILNECKCSTEEMFVLLGSVFPGTADEIDSYLQRIVVLVNVGLLECRKCPCSPYRHGEDASPLKITLDDLREYVQQRLDAGEELDEYPIVAQEYAFVTTDLGIQCLKEKDRPYTLER